MRTFLPALLVSVLLLVACDDPSAVGLTLADGDSGGPEVVAVSPSRFDNEDGIDVTGDTPRVLTGSVEDPVSGSVTARGYVGFLASSAFSTDYIAGPVTAARLELQTDYRYGDTLSGGTLSLADIESAWVSTATPADTALAAGPVVGTVTYQVTDSVVVVELPAEWITRFDATLRSSAYADSFFGFQMTAEDAEAVMGFSVADSRLTVDSGGSSQEFTILQRFSSLARTADPTPPPGTVVLQDGAGPAVAIAFDLDDLSDAVFNRSEVVLEVASSLLEESTPPNFVRPVVTSLEMQGVTSSGLPIAFEEAAVSDGRAVFDSNVLRNTLQDIARGDDFIDHFRFAVPPLANGVGVVLLADTSAVDGPRSILTVSRFN